MNGSSQTSIISADFQPTKEAYGELQHAYDYFNQMLFDHALPHCLLTLQRHRRRTMGYFCPARFARHDGTTTDEIALNPVYFKTSSDKVVCATLVHEMCHLWQDHSGQRRSPRGYHNKEWARKMKEIGLQPSHTGEPGGKETGRRMGDYPIAGGRFERAAEALLSTAFRISWHEHVTAQEEDDSGTGSPDARPKRSGQRVKFTCPGCQANAWGKASLDLVCGACSKGMASSQLTSTVIRPAS